MNKKMIAIILLVAAVLVVLVFLGLRRGGAPISINKGKITSASALISQAKESESKGELAQAKALYLELINEFPNSGDVMNWQRKLENINIKMLFSGADIPKSAVYEIKPGDTLAKIAKEFKTTVELIKKSNNLSEDKIMPGRKIRVYTAPFSILVDKSQNILILKSEEEVYKTYIVSTGANNSTPVGTFKIMNKLANPTWFKAGAVVPASSPENVLGTRWLGFNLSGYGIHGTIEPESLGRQVTQGCVRMSNPEVEELYVIVPVGTEVTIVD